MAIAPAYQRTRLRLPLDGRWSLPGGLVEGVHGGNDAVAGWDISQQFLGAAWEQPEGIPGYMRSGTGMPSSPRPVTSTRKVSADSASLLCRMAGSGACSTGHCS